MNHITHTKRKGFIQYQSIAFIILSLFFLLKDTRSFQINNNMYKRLKLGHQIFKKRYLRQPSSSLLSTFSRSSDGYDYDVIVIGGGHAGCEAASASARTGAKTALVTQRIDTIGELSCNPSIGGIGKGHLVREVDALGGVIGECADMAGIHFRVLNRRKGPAVRGPRAQADRDLYKSAMQNILLHQTPNLSIIEAGAEDLLLDPNTQRSTSTSILDLSNDSNGATATATVQGVVLDSGKHVTSKSVIITTGTFLRGVLLLGKNRYSGGRHLRDSEKVEPPSIGLAKTLQTYNFELGRMKTGTPPRLDGKTIDWDSCVPQPSEYPCPPFSHIRQFTGEKLPNQDQLITCYKSHTTAETHKLVKDYAYTLPEYDGMDGKGNGPRYCPSIFKKVERFPDRDSHNSFLEPEGLNTDIVYPNGMSGPFPEEIQLKIMRSMPGLSSVEITSPGYDVEYDYVNPQTLTHTLETKQIQNLYLAGQICGTTGYEEAAAQGIIAGANAGRISVASAHLYSSSSSKQRPEPFIVGRDEGYIGVLIDDLVTRGTNEPYRMFTSRAEYRISLRADNADLRLTRKGMKYNLVNDSDRIMALEERERMISENINRLKAHRLFVTEWAEKGGDKMGGDAVFRKGREGNMKTGEEILQMPKVNLKDVEDIIGDVPSPPSIYDTVEASVKYKSYVIRQERDMESWRKAQGTVIPPDLVYDHSIFPTLSKEELEKLGNAKPRSFAEASQISGVTPQSLVFLYHHIMKRNKTKDKERADFAR